MTTHIEKRTQQLMKRMERYKVDETLDQIDDDIDIKKHFLSVHFPEIDRILSKDVRLAVLGKEEKQFIRDMIGRCYECSMIFHKKADKAMKYAVVSLAIEAGAIINTNINEANNPSFGIVIPKEVEKPLPDIDEKLLEKLEGKKK